jgi:menaquinone-specific isochorismate synthase
VKQLPLDPRKNASPEALLNFLTECRAVAAHRGQAQLVSISLEVDALDPLAVLESIFEPDERHFYVERPSEGFALAGAEAVLAFTTAGRDRFRECQQFIDQTLDNTLCVGPADAVFGGPHFFHAFSFMPQVEPMESFEAASVFVPRWQVATRGAVTIAVANVLVDINTPVEQVAQRVWRARNKFESFDYAEPQFHPDTKSTPISVSEVGGDNRFRESVAEALRRVGAGQFEKIVLARAKDLRSNAPFHPLRVLNGLRQRFPECYAFSVANGRRSSLIGASPERLVKISDGKLFTEALAGSARRGSSASEDAALGGALLKSEKDLLEHSYVVNAIKRRLAPLGIDISAASRPSLRRLANVQHLHTPITANLPESVRALEVLEALHPTPAVGGTPRERAVPQIRELEAFPRGLYAGALGWLDGHGRGEFFVGLRCALVEGERARLYAGAGIVAGSEPEKEFQETELKFKPLIEALLA